MRYFPALLFLLLSFSLSAQMESQEQVVQQFLNGYNAQRAARDWATTERTDVTFSVGEHHTLVAVLADGTRIDLDRTAADPMDGMFPLVVENATVISTNATTLFVDPAGEHHFGFTLLDAPSLPALTRGYFTLFAGDGIGRRTVVE